MIIAHDLVEAIAGDIPFFEESVRQSKKIEAEIFAMDEIVKTLPEPASSEIKGLWLEFESLKTNESRFVKALDNLEVQMQHNWADLSTWEPIEYELVYSKMRPRCSHDSFLNELCTLVEMEAEQKMRDGKIDVDSVHTRVPTKAE